MMFVLYLLDANEVIVFSSFLMHEFGLLGSQLFWDMLFIIKLSLFISTQILFFAHLYVACGGLLGQRSSKRLTLGLSKCSLYNY
jgi:hypothetical protein